MSGHLLARIRWAAAGFAPVAVAVKLAACTAQPSAPTTPTPTDTSLPAGLLPRTVRVRNDTHEAVIVHEWLNWAPRPLLQTPLAAGATLTLSQSADLIRLSTAPVGSGEMQALHLNVWFGGGQMVRCLSTEFRSRRVHERDVPVDLKVSAAAARPCDPPAYPAPATLSTAAWHARGG